VDPVPIATLERAFDAIATRCRLPADRLTVGYEGGLTGLVIELLGHQTIIRARHLHGALLLTVVFDPRPPPGRHAGPPRRNLQPRPSPMTTLAACFRELERRQRRLAEAESRGWRECILQERRSVAEMVAALEMMLLRHGDALVARAGDLELGPLPFGRSCSATRTKRQAMIRARIQRHLPGRATPALEPLLTGEPSRQGRR
jgi:hypothetical protein